MKKYECKACDDGPCFLETSFDECCLDYCPAYGNEAEWREVKEEVDDD